MKDTYVLRSLSDGTTVKRDFAYFELRSWDEITWAQVQAMHNPRVPGQHTAKSLWTLKLTYTQQTNPHAINPAKVPFKAHFAMTRGAEVKRRANNMLRDKHENRSLFQPFVDAWQRAKKHVKANKPDASHPIQEPFAGFQTERLGRGGTNVFAINYAFLIPVSEVDPTTGQIKNYCVVTFVQNRTRLRTVILAATNNTDPKACVFNGYVDQIHRYAQKQNAISAQFQTKIEGVIYGKEESLENSLEQQDTGREVQNRLCQDIAPIECVPESEGMVQEVEPTRATGHGEAASMGRTVASHMDDARSQEANEVEPTASEPSQSLPAWIAARVSQCERLVLDSSGNEPRRVGGRDNATNGGRPCVSAEAGGDRSGDDLTEDQIEAMKQKENQQWRVYVDSMKKPMSLGTAKEW